MATFWVRAAHSVNRIFVLCIIYLFGIFGFERKTLVLTAPVPGHCLLYTLHR